MQIVDEAEQQAGMNSSWEAILELTNYTSVDRATSKV